MWLQIMQLRVGEFSIWRRGPEAPGLDDKSARKVDKHNRHTEPQNSKEVYHQ